MPYFFVAGAPVPKGSAKAFVNKRTGRAQVVQDNREKQRPWASSISWTAQKEGLTPVDGPVAVEMIFHMPRPKKHFNSKGVLRKDAPAYHTSKTGDLDKLERCVLDALTGIAYQDDCQVAVIRSVKKYNERVGVWICIKYL